MAKTSFPKNISCIEELGCRKLLLNRQGVTQYQCVSPFAIGIKMTSYRSCVNVHGNVTCTSVTKYTCMHKIVKRSSTPSHQNQGQILDDQDFDPGRKRRHALILGDPLIDHFIILLILSIATVSVTGHKNYP